MSKKRKRKNGGSQTKEDSRRHEIDTSLNQQHDTSTEPDSLTPVGQNVLAKNGVLYVVATPIGNLRDMTFRAIQMLQQCDLVLAEDTRSFGKLAREFNIETSSISFYEHNEKGRVPQAIELLEKGQSLALVSEAGTPGISDPGYRLIRECRQRSIPVFPIPGACAAISALSVSGLPTDRFCFEGFLPQKPGKKRKVVEEILKRGITTVVYESPYRIQKTLDLLAELSPNGELLLARELTKLHEETIFANAHTIAKNFRARENVRGEFVIIIHPPLDTEAREELLTDISEDDEVF